MNSTSNEQPIGLSPDKFVSARDREQAIEDGTLIDAGYLAWNAGFDRSVMVTSAVWNKCVAWTEDDNAQQVRQSSSRRLNSILYMAFHAIRMNKGWNDTRLFQIRCVPRDGRSTQPIRVTLRLIAGPTDTSESASIIACY